MSTVGSSRKSASVPLPWWTSKSTIATRVEPELALGVARGDRDVVEDAEAHRADASAWWPGGRTSAKPPVLDSADRAARSEARRLPRRRARERVRRRATPPRGSRRPRRRSAARGRARSARASAGSSVHVVPESARAGTRADPGARDARGRRAMEVRERGMADHVHVSASSNRRATCAQPELAGVRGRRRPVGRDVGQRRKRSVAIHRRDPPIEAERVGLGREATVLEHRLERAVLAEQLRGALLADAARARDPSDGSPRSAMKSGTCAGSTP